MVATTRSISSALRSQVGYLNVVMPADLSEPPARMLVYCSNPVQYASSENNGNVRPLLFVNQSCSSAGSRNNVLSSSPKLQLANESSFKFVKGARFLRDAAIPASSESAMFIS